MWKVGDELIFIRGHNVAQHTKDPLTVGARVTMIAEAPPYLVRSCPDHGDVQFIDVDTPYYYCCHCFRKPIDLNSYFNLQTKVKEPA